MAVVKTWKNANKENGFMLACNKIIKKVIWIRTLGDFILRTPSHNCLSNMRNYGVRWSWRNNVTITFGLSRYLCLEPFLHVYFLFLQMSFSVFQNLESSFFPFYWISSYSFSLSCECQIWFVKTLGGNEYPAYFWCPPVGRLPF